MNPSKTYLRQEMRRYLASISDVSPEERAALAAWVAQGYSPYSNPSYLADERGRELPFIHALREE